MTEILAAFETIWIMCKIVLVCGGVYVGTILLEQLGKKGK